MVMNGHGKSDDSVVPMKLPNKGGGAPSSAEGAEGRESAKGNLVQQNTGSALSGGMPCKMRWNGYGRQQRGTGRRGLPHFGTTCTESIAYAKHSSA